MPVVLGSFLAEVFLWVGSAVACCPPIQAVMYGSRDAAGKEFPMKTINCWDDLSRYGIVPLTSETQYLLCHTAMCLPTGA